MRVLTMRVFTTLRRLVARRPWVQWVVIVAVGVATVSSVAGAMDAVDAERDAWGRRVTVWVAASEIAVGEQVDAVVVEVPEALRPDGAVAATAEIDALVARQKIGRGEMLVAHDVVSTQAPFDVVPPGWLVAPIVESPPSGVSLGERVQVVSDGLVLAPDGIVVGSVDHVTLVAVPAEVAPLLPLASTNAAVTLLRSP